MIESGAGDTAQFPDATYEAVGTYRTCSVRILRTYATLCAEILEVSLKLLCDLFVS